MNETQTTPSMDGMIPDVSRVAITATMDLITSVSLGHGTCELIPNKVDKTACRHLLEPLEEGKGDPIEQLSDVQMANPEEFDKLTEYFNSVIIRVTERSEQKLAAMQKTQ